MPLNVFFCGGCVKSWENGDVPWVEYARWFPKCAFLLRIKGQKFINTFYEPDNGTAQVAKSNGAKGPLFNSTQEIINAVLELDSPKNREPEVEIEMEVPGRQQNVHSNRDNIPEIGNLTIARLKRENKELKEQRLCKICMIAEANSVILPCSHLAVCVSCSLTITKCPLCSKKVTETVKIFIP